MKRSSRALTAAVAVLMVSSWTGPKKATAQQDDAAPEVASPSSAQAEVADAGATPEQATDGPGGRRAGRALLPGSTLPPRNLKLVGDHWTPYDPPDPETFPPDATLHIIVPGDTLWDLADLAFGNPYLWPQIWNENRYILDSHWIYPGDPLLLPPRPTVIGEVVPQGQEGAPPPPPVETAAEEEDDEEAPEEALTAETPGPQETREPAPARVDRGITLPPKAAPRPELLADDSDIRCTGFIARRSKRSDYFIADQEDEARRGLSVGDYIYLNRGRENGHVEPGTEYSVIEREEEVIHPVTGRNLGVYYRRLGTVRVVAYGEDTAIAVISQACDEIRSGYELVPLAFPALPAKPVPPFNRFARIDEDKPSGYIVRLADNIAHVATGYTVDIDLGHEDGVKAGDYLLVYLPGQPSDKYPPIAVDYRWQNRHVVTEEVRRDHRAVPPPKVIGQLVVLKTEKRTATAKVVQSLREIGLGASVVAQ